MSGDAAHSNNNNLYAELGWPSLGQRRIEHTSSMFYKIFHADAPAYLCDMLPHTVGDKSDYNLYSAHKMDIPFTRLECHRRSFFPFVICAWNNLTYDTIMATYIKDFKIAICYNKKVPNTLYYYGQKWHSIHHDRISMDCSKVNQHLFHTISLKIFHVNVVTQLKILLTLS